MTDLSVKAMVDALVRETKAKRLKWEPSDVYDLQASLPDETTLHLTVGHSLYIRVGNASESIYVERVHALPLIELVEDVLAYHERLKEDRQFKMVRDLTRRLGEQIDRGA